MAKINADIYFLFGVALCQKLSIIAGLVHFSPSGSDPFVLFMFAIHITPFVSKPAE